MNTRAKHRVQNGAVKRSGHAVVLGGSIAGLLAARVLSDHFERVTLIERDAYPETPQARKGTPQANHVHGMLMRGRQILEDLFPGLQDEMIAAGAPEVDVANEVAWFTPAGWGVRFKSDLLVLSFTRPMLDFHVRRRIALNRESRFWTTLKSCACLLVRLRIILRACSFALAQRKEIEESRRSCRRI